MTQAFLSIGSNQNNPLQQIESAFSKLEVLFGTIEHSSIYVTQPVGHVKQEPFMNAAILLETGPDPYELLDVLMSLEKEAGRDRVEEIPNGPRNLDLDIILFANLTLVDDELTVPHPRFRQRRFVLKPLSEIAAHVVDPVTGKSISQLLEECEDNSWVVPMNEKVLAQ